MNKKYDIIFAIMIIIIVIVVIINETIQTNLEVGKNAATAEQVYQACIDAIPDNSNLKTYGEYEMSVKDYYNMMDNCNKVYERLQK